ncbi:MAG: iron-containing alcohol dehydrogenase [Oscillospiraceae bacterium]|nr:iron-containing alcohol dehydrogenase [Oscillospiraceae bacterium]
MISFNSLMPVEIIFDKNCVLKNKEKFNGFKKLFIVSDKSSAILSGALNDIMSIVKDTKAEFYIFDNIQENPLLSVCYEGGKAACDFGADLIIGIGGGSPLDAAKVIAFFAANPDRTPEDLFNLPYENPSLPIFAIPTTAGTGSEANPYAIMTLDGQDLKKTFTYIKSYAQTAFLDPKYTLSLPYNVTVSTALDALCHCIESYLSVKSTPFSIAYASLGIKSVYHNLEKLIDLKDKPISEIDYSVREELLLGSLCGGIAINTTGTCFPHPLGYNITLINGLPHGKACALFIGEFLNIHETAAKNLDMPELNKNLNEMYAAFDTPIEKAKETIKILTDYHEKFDDETLKFYVSKVKTAKNFTNSYKKILTDDEMFEIYKKCVGK